MHKLKVSQSLQLGQTGANLFLAFSLLAKAGNFLAKEITNPKEVPSPTPMCKGSWGAFKGTLWIHLIFPTFEYLVSLLWWPENCRKGK